MSTSVRLLWNSDIVNNFTFRKYHIALGSWTVSVSTKYNHVLKASFNTKRHI
jgi:hypothetical protein